MPLLTFSPRHCSLLLFSPDYFCYFYLYAAYFRRHFRFSFDAMYLIQIYFHYFAIFAIIITFAMPLLLRHYLRFAVSSITPHYCRLFIFISFFLLFSLFTPCFDYYFISIIWCHIYFSLFIFALIDCLLRHYYYAMPLLIFHCYFTLAITPFFIFIFLRHFHYAIFHFHCRWYLRHIFTIFFVYFSLFMLLCFHFSSTLRCHFAIFFGYAISFDFIISYDFAITFLLHFEADIFIVFISLFLLSAGCYCFHFHCFIASSWFIIFVDYWRYYDIRQRKRHAGDDATERHIERHCCHYAMPCAILLAPLLLVRLLYCLLLCLLLFRHIYTPFSLICFITRRWFLDAIAEPFHFSITLRRLRLRHFFAAIILRDAVHCRWCHYYFAIVFDAAFCFSSAFFRRYFHYYYRRHFTLTPRYIVFQRWCLCHAFISPHAALLMLRAIMLPLLLLSCCHDIAPLFSPSAPLMMPPLALRVTRHYAAAMILRRLLLLLDTLLIFTPRHDYWYAIIYYYFIFDISPLFYATIFDISYATMLSFHAAFTLAFIYFIAYATPLFHWLLPLLLLCAISMRHWYLRFHYAFIYFAAAIITYFAIRYFIASSPPYFTLLSPPLCYAIIFIIYIFRDFHIFSIISFSFSMLPLFYWYIIKSAMMLFERARARARSAIAIIAAISPPLTPLLMLHFAIISFAPCRRFADDDDTPPRWATPIRRVSLSAIIDAIFFDIFDAPLILFDIDIITLIFAAMPLRLLFIIFISLASLFSEHYFITISLMLSFISWYFLYAIYFTCHLRAFIDYFHYADIYCFSLPFRCHFDAVSLRHYISFSLRWYYAYYFADIFAIILYYFHFIFHFFHYFRHYATIFAA